ncbi:hypothetical protein RhiirA1_485401, partial [Rhizophagus irregularis]
KAKIRVDKGAFLLGVLDVTEILQENQIYCYLDDDFTNCTMNYEAQKSRMVENVTMKDIKTFFVNYIFSDNFGMIENAH